MTDHARAWHAVVAALMEAVRIPQLVGWLGRLTNRALVARQNMQERLLTTRGVGVMSDDE